MSISAVHGRSVDVQPPPARSGGVARWRQHRAATRIDVDFTLAVHNRTGKYFIGRDLIDGAADLIGRIYYGPMHFGRLPQRWVGRVLARIQYLQTRHHFSKGRWGIPRRRSARALLHLDPFTVGSVVLRPGDVVLCHDVGPITHPDLFEPHVSAAYDTIYREIADVQPRLVFVSQASLHAFHQRFPHVPQSRSTVIYPAIRARRGTGSSAPAALSAGPFLLTVGSIGSRKNQLASVRAFARSGLAERGYLYVLCGAREPGFEQVAEAAEAIPGVLLLPYVAEAELAWLYEHASGFVLASKLEGFGMPVAEAVAHGLVPAVTRGSVLQEVAGDDALLVDAEDEDTIAAAMIALADMPDAERRRRRAGLTQAIARFTPEAFVAAWRAALLAVLAGTPE
ncbi:glycosyltransferase family 1 protein [uncultured Sphingomonas sp.]|uniref:glycosyltransferase family 4 protein n=1 Tax=uncultured Sphingomonas sp. TaxID=158754 RepID=UPI0025F4AF31|nr:glycosyltransferase family 1 protein [uncultured Sphingomonas sp.]